MLQAERQRFREAQESKAQKRLSWDKEHTAWLRLQAEELSKHVCRIWIIPGLWHKKVRFCCLATRLALCRDEISLGVMAQALVSGLATPRQRKILIATLTEMLMTAPQMLSLTPVQLEALGKIARSVRWARREPDLVSAVMVFLRTLRTPASHAILLQIAERPLRHKRDAWIADAARLCLERW
jgi:hypothetical protein